MSLLLLLFLRVPPLVYSGHTSLTLLGQVKSSIYFFQCFNVRDFTVLYTQYCLNVLQSSEPSIVNIKHKLPRTDITLVH